jgi:hypothetical protein
MQGCATTENAMKIATALLALLFATPTIAHDEV